MTDNYLVIIAAVFSLAVFIIGFWLLLPWSMLWIIFFLIGFLGTRIFIDRKR